jgi:predicted transcriptional regulator
MAVEPDKDLTTMSRDELVETLAHKPLMLSVLKIVSEKSQTPTDVALKLNKLPSNIARMMSALDRMGVLEAERRGKTKLYRIPESKRVEMKSIIEETMNGDVSDARSRLTERFYQNLLYSGLRKVAPNGWNISVNPKLQMGGTTLSLDVGISDESGLVAGVELNMGPPGQHLYALIGRAIVGQREGIRVLILVLLTPHANDFAFLKRIRLLKSQPRFEVILREMPLASETVFAQNTAKEILSIIKNLA